MNEFELFQSALDIVDDPAARKLFLNSACEHDAELLIRVEALLAVHESQSQFLSTPVVEQIADISGGGTASTIFFEDGSTQDQEPDATEDLFTGSALMAVHQEDSGNEIPLSYLQPSAKPGSLGRLAHYEILEVIGHGAFGTVFRAFDEKLQRVVAIKIMAQQMAATSPARRRFLREAQASAAIRHEHVVSVFAVEEKPLPYLVMEYIPGQTLQQRLDERGPLDVPNSLRLGRQIAEGLAAAHAINLIHRDIKPGNILLETAVHDRVKITDFGLARAADDASLTQSGTIAGTPMYMAPEQALGHKLDQRADLFSLGSVLYQMVSGRPPFRAPSTMAVLKRVTEDTPRPITEVIPETPQWLCDIITRLHAKNPDERYQSAQEVAEVLADCEAQLKANAKPQEFSKIAGVKSRSGSGGWKWIAAAALIVVVLTLALTENAGVTHLFRGQQPIPTIASNAEPKAESTAAAKADLVANTRVVPVGPSGRDQAESEANDKPVASRARFTDADVQRIAALPAAAQIEEVREELMRRNPGFDGELEHQIEEGVVRELRINPDQVTDISPLRVFNALRKLECFGTTTAESHGSGQLADLTPLTGMKLDELKILNLGWTKVDDASLTLFKDCQDLDQLYLPGTQVSDEGLGLFAECRKLTVLHLARTQVSDRGLAHFKDSKNLIFLALDATMTTDAGLANFRDCKNLAHLFLAATRVTDAGLSQFDGKTELINLNLGATNVGDEGVANFRGCKNLKWLWLEDTKISNAGLAHFQGCNRLQLLWINGTHVTDLSLVKEFPLTEIYFDFKADGQAEILRSIQTLVTINGKPAAEFWKEVRR